MKFPKVFFSASFFVYSCFVGFSEELISYDHTGASKVPSFIDPALTSTASLGGGISGTNLVTTINNLSANHNDGLRGGSSASPSPTGVDWFSYSIASTDTSILYEKVELTVFSGVRGPQLYDLTYLDSAGVEYTLAENVNLNAAGTESFDLPVSTFDVVEFRVYVHDRIFTNNSSSRVSIDDFAVFGSRSDSGMTAFPDIGQAELKFLQNEEDGDVLDTSVRQMRLASNLYLPNAYVPLGAYKEGSVHKLVVNTSDSDSTLVAEFSVVEEGGEIELVSLAQGGKSKISLLNAGLGSLSNSAELALQLPDNLGDVTVTHYVSSLESWAYTQYTGAHFDALGEETVIRKTPKGDISMGDFQ